MICWVMSVKLVFGIVKIFKLIFIVVFFGGDVVFYVDEDDIKGIVKGE